MASEIHIEKKLGSFQLSVHLDLSGGGGEGAHSVTALLGASGSGKSMALKCIAGIVRPDRGRITVDGVTLYDSEKKICLPPQTRQVGYVFQNYALFPTMTVEQNIACGIIGAEMQRKRVPGPHRGRLLKEGGLAAQDEGNAGRSLSREERRQKIADICRRMQLDGLEKRRPDQLSGGQMQRAALARILIGQPRIILLDEPFSALDEYLRDQILDETMQTVEEAAVDVLFVTHSRSEARRAARRVAVIHDGSIQEAGETEKIFSRPATYWGRILTGQERPGRN